METAQLIDEWVYLRSGRIKKIFFSDYYRDSGFDFENVIRVATPDEVPEFKHKVIGGNLNKENFWDIADKRCPAATKLFYNWIDKYKESVRWSKLFNYGSPHDKPMGWHDPKFHHIPVEMQLGILIRFFDESYESLFTGRFTCGRPDYRWSILNPPADEAAFWLMDMEVNLRNKGKE